MGLVKRTEVVPPVLPSSEGSPGTPVGLSSLSSSSLSSSWLAETDVELSRPKRKQAIFALIGEDGHCKTGTALRFMPDPIAIFSFDGRGENEINLVRETLGRTIYPVYLPIPPTDLLKPSESKVLGLDMIRKINKNMRAFTEAAKSGRQIKSIIFDTGSEAQLIFDLAYRGTTDAREQASLEDDGKKSKVFGSASYEISRVWFSLFTMIKASPAHFCCICRQSEKWIDNSPTGQFKIDGDKAISRGVDLILRISRQAETRRVAGKNNEVKYVLTGRESKETELAVVNAKLNLEELNKIYVPKMWREDEDAQGNPFIYTMMRHVLGSRKEDWV